MNKTRGEWLRLYVYIRRVCIIRKKKMWESIPYAVVGVGSEKYAVCIFRHAQPQVFKYHSVGDTKNDVSMISSAREKLRVLEQIDKENIKL